MAAGLGRLVIILAFQARNWLNSEADRTDRSASDGENRELPVGTDKSRVQQLRDGKAWAIQTEARLTRAVICDAWRNRQMRTDIGIQFFFDANGKFL
jgi:hypothetical protein